ncbi:hypothetical protein C8R44DRAFT_876739 [Mycena epipterygia]|nr:hypothetical protein C8R44DRAFT_876739 [Mycena epipterygia]
MSASSPAQSRARPCPHQSALLTLPPDLTTVATLGSRTWARCVRRRRAWRRGAAIRDAGAFLIFVVPELFRSRPTRPSTLFDDASAVLRGGMRRASPRRVAASILHVPIPVVVVSLPHAASSPHRRRRMQSLFHIFHSPSALPLLPSPICQIASTLHHIVHPASLLLQCRIHLLLDHHACSSFPSRLPRRPFSQHPPIGLLLISRTADPRLLSLSPPAPAFFYLTLTLALAALQVDKMFFKLTVRCSILKAGDHRGHGQVFGIDYAFTTKSCMLMPFVSRPESVEIVDSSSVLSPSVRRSKSKSKSSAPDLYRLAITRNPTKQWSRN